MNSLETRTAIDSERGAFDSHETRILSAAFEKAWAFVEFDPELGFWKHPRDDLNLRVALWRC